MTDELPEGFPEFPDDLWQRMPPETYCRCGATWTGKVTEPDGVTVSVRIMCNVCGFWTGPVPTSNE